MKKNIKTGMKLADVMLHERSQTQRAHAAQSLSYEVQSQTQLVRAETRLLCADTAVLAPNQPFKPFFVHVCVCPQSLSRVPLWLPWTATHQASLFMGCSRQEHWSEVPFPPTGDLSNPGVKPMCPVSLALTGGFSTTEPPGKPLLCTQLLLYTWIHQMESYYTSCFISFCIQFNGDIFPNQMNFYARNDF